MALVVRELEIFYTVSFVVIVLVVSSAITLRVPENISFMLFFLGVLDISFKMFVFYLIKSSNS